MYTDVYIDILYVERTGVTYVRLPAGGVNLSHIEGVLLDTYIDGQL